MNQYNLFEGIKKRDEGIAEVERNNDFVIALLRNKAREISRACGRVCADDLRQYVETEGLHLHSNAWGAIFKQDGWTQICWKQSEWEPNHARVVRVWRWDGTK